MRIVNRAHLPWFIFVVAATFFATWLYIGNFTPQTLPSALRLPDSLFQKPPDHHGVGGTPLGLIVGTIALSIFVFAALLGVRKKIVLWRIGTVQRWLRAHIWLTLLTIPLVTLHSGFRLGGPMTTLIIILYVVVMVSGIYGLVLQHYVPTVMMERLPAESVYEQIPHIRAQLVAAVTKMRDSFKPAPPTKADAGAPAPSPAKAVTAGSAPMASTAADLSTPTARAKSVVGSTIIAETIAPPEKSVPHRQTRRSHAPRQTAFFRRHVPLRQTPRYRSLSRSRRRNAGLVRRTADARSPNQIASLAARLAVRPRADLVSAADARFLARICDVVQVLSRCRNRDAPKNRSPSVTKAISVIIADSIPGGARDSSSVYSRSLADWSRSGFFKSTAAKLFLTPAKSRPVTRSSRTTAPNVTTAMPSLENLPRCYAIVFVTASPSKRSIANARLVMRSTAFTKRTSFKTAPARRVIRNIAGLVILDWSRARNARPATTTPP